jgi:hypothetical protein
MSENNIALTGEEARALILSLAHSEAQLPSKMVISLWMRLNQISQVQPAVNPEEKQ